MGSKTEHLKSDGMPETRKERCKAYALAVAVASAKSIDGSLRVLDPFDFPGIMSVDDSIPDEPENGINLAVEAVPWAVINDLQSFEAKLNIRAISPHKRRHERESVMRPHCIFRDDVRRNLIDAQHIQSKKPGGSESVWTPPGREPKC